MAESGFGDRLTYLRWLYMLRTGQYLPAKRITEALGVDASWMTKWSQRDDAPNDRNAERVLESLFNAPGRWIMDGDGAAPESALWQRWRAERDGKPVDSEGGIPYEADVASGKQKGKRQA